MSGQQKFLTFMLCFFLFLSLSHTLGFVPLLLSDFAWVMVGFVVTVVNSVAIVWTLCVWIVFVIGMVACMSQHPHRVASEVGRTSQVCNYTLHLHTHTDTSTMHSICIFL